MGKAERKLQRRRAQNPDIATEEELEEEEDVMEVVMDLLRLVGPYLAVGLLILAGLFFVKKLTASKASSENRVSNELRQESDPAKLIELVDANPKTPEAANQLMRSAKASYNNGNFQAAMEAYDRVVKKYKSYPMVDGAALNIATCMENLGRIDEAKAAYEKWLSDYPESFRAPLAKLGAARCLLQTNPPQAEAAKAAFQSFLDDDPDGPFADKAESYLEDAERLLRAGS